MNESRSARSTTTQTQPPRGGGLTPLASGSDYVYYVPLPSTVLYADARMIRGKVDDKLQPMIGIQLRESHGSIQVDFEVKLDTGFNGELGLPASVLNLLEKTHFETRAVRFADDRSDIVNAYYVNALIDGEPRRMVAYGFRFRRADSSVWKLCHHGPDASNSKSTAMSPSRNRN